MFNVRVAIDHLYGKFLIMTVRAKTHGADRKIQSATCICLHQGCCQNTCLCTPSFIIIGLWLHLRIGVHFKISRPVYRRFQYQTGPVSTNVSCTISFISAWLIIDLSIRKCMYSSKLTESFFDNCNLLKRCCWIGY